MARHMGHIVTALILIMVSASFAMAASVAVSTSGNGVYTVQGNSMDNISGIDLTLNYDTGSLSSPSVTLGSLATGAMMAANTTVAGSIRIAIIRLNAFSGSGPVATIAFATHTGNGTVSIASSSFVNESGSTVAGNSATSTGTTTGATAGTSSGADTAGGTSTTATTATTAATATATATTATASSGNNPVYLGTVTMPTDSQGQNVAKPSPAPETTAKPAETPAPAEAPAPVEAPAAKEAPVPAKPAETVKKPETVTIGTVANTAVLERFRAYRGVKTPAIMISIFKRPISPSFSQKPFVALSDGATTVTIVANLPAEAGTAPNFALNNATLVSLKKDGASSAWLIETLPAKGALRASLMVMSNDRITEYPLTIAPAIPNPAATEAEFAAFLKDAGQTPAQHDVNGDGKYDGIDDYIYTANYLVRQMKKH